MIIENITNYLYVEGLVFDSTRSPMRGASSSNLSPILGYLCGKISILIWAAPVSNSCDPNPLEEAVGRNGKVDLKSNSWHLKLFIIVLSCKFSLSLSLSLSLSIYIYIYIFPNGIDPAC